LKTKFLIYISSRSNSFDNKVVTKGLLHYLYAIIVINSKACTDRLPHLSFSF